jgi:signal transduction histidine kinase
VLDVHEQIRASHADVQVAEPLPRVRASRPALTQTLSNLLGNAVKFVAPGTTPRVRVHGEAKGPRVRIWVEDNGIGIAPGNLEKIWGMLERLNPSYEGTGVGLSIVRKAVERMGGSTGVESELGKGSRFWIELPRAG